MILSNNPDKNTPEFLIEENPIHDILKSFGANIEGLNKPIDFDTWTRWGKNSRYSARLIRGVVGDEGLVYQDFTSSEKPKVVFFNNLQDPSEEQLFLRESMTEQAYQEAVIETQRKHEEAAILANHLWEEARIEGTSEYLDKKQVMAYGLRFSEDQYGRFLVVPLYDAAGKLWNVQKIYNPSPDGSNNKWFLTGGLKKGCFYILGKSLRELLNSDSTTETFVVCEGYATGASIHAATGLPIVVAFDGGNLGPVVASLKETFPAIDIVIAADNDQWNETSINKGLEEAQKAASQHGCGIVYPHFRLEHHVSRPTDFNDLHSLEGLETVKNQLNNFRHMDVWEHPQPLKHEKLPVVPLPLDIVPNIFQPWIQDIAHRMQCPLEHVAIPAMVMVASVIGARCSIRPKQNDSWTIIPNLWGGIIGHPSTLKTPALTEALSPMAYLENKAREDFKKEEENYEFALEAHKILKDTKISQIKKNIKANRAFQCFEYIEKELKEFDEPDVPLCKRYKTNDATIEKMTELLEQNPTGMMLFRDELMGLFMTWDKQGREADRAFYLEAWNGYGSHTTDRIERGTTHCDNMCVSIVGGTQPSKILRYLQKAIRGIDNDGLVQRFQLFVYPDDLKVWQLIDQHPDKQAQETVFKLVETISTMDFVKYGASQDEDNGIPYFRFSEKAQELFYGWLTELETTKLRGKEDSIIVEHLSKYRKLMPALALIIHVIDTANEIAEIDVSLEAAEKAAAWCDFLELHARRIYGIAANMTLSAASILFKKLKQRKLENGFTVRDVYRKDWSLLSDKELAEDACHELVRLGWLRELITDFSSGQKGKTSYTINPNIWEQS